MKYCPLHHEEPAGDFRRSPWPIFIKPTEAGIRVLTLDGGGIRGIVELTILQQIENALGEGLRIQSFFDLIVGTSTGGIISLGLGSMGWPVDKCMGHFESLCRDAFRKRKGVGWPGIDFLVSASNHSRYQTKPLEDALKYAFGGEHLFGGLRDLSNPEIMSTVRTRVAVTTTTTNGSVFLLANYNRINTVESSAYQFHRSEKPRDEIKIWEAARATSAAPRIFKPFDHVNSGQQFQDGAIYHNNPIALAMRERQLIWPEMAEMNPDIVLSIGTSFNPNSKRGQIDPRSRFGMLAHAKQLAKIAIDHVLSTLDSERTWHNYIQHLPSDKVRERYIRLNLQLRDDPPRLYEVDMMHELREMTQSRFTKQKEQIMAVANRLIATLFYFERSASEAHENQDHSVTVTGSIVCRFAPGSEEMRALGGAFHKRSIAAYRQTDSRHDPYFVISEQRREKEAQQIVIGDHVIDKMMRDGRFSMGQVTLTLSNKVAETEISLCFADRRDNPAFYPISGFPRCLLQADARLSAKSRSSLNLGRKRTPTSLNRGTWSLPPLLITNHDPIQRYEAEDYLYPGDATSDAISEISQRFSSPEPTQADFPQHSVASMNELAYQLNAQELDSTVRAELPTDWNTYSPQWQTLPPRAPMGTTPEKTYEMG
jgi:predicted acylesterase/phospholipase RssA